MPMLQRLAFWIQVPGVLLAAFASFLVSENVHHKNADTRNMREKLASLDYLGTITLVSNFELAVDQIQS